MWRQLLLHFYLRRKLFHVCVCAHGYVSRAQASFLRLPLYYSSFCLILNLETVSHLTPAHFSLARLAEPLQGPSFLYSDPDSGVTRRGTCLAFLSPGHSYLRPHTCIAGALCTEPSPHPLGIDFSLSLPQTVNQKCRKIRTLCL